MQTYFALDFHSGLLYNLGEMDTFDEAEQACSKLEIDAIWILDEQTAIEWRDYLTDQLDNA